MRALAVGAVLVAVLAGIVALFSSSTQGAKRDACGEERWGVKTLTDTGTNPNAADIDFAHPKTKTVESLRRVNDKGRASSGKPPKDLKKTSPRLPPVETTVYKVTALLMSMKREDDKDIHLVIADPKIGGSMIAEFPAASCTTDADPARQVEMEAARQALDDACGPLPTSSGTLVTLKGKVTMTGAGFFDLIHGQGGVATNGIELHPVLSVTGATCNRVSNP
jgi:hypothetical protein